eukprot:15443851-Alexandrium_andersonii.AAC.1
MCIRDSALAAGGEVAVHPSRFPVRKAALVIMINNIQAKLKLPKGKKGGWNDEATHLLMELLAKPPRQRVRGDSVLPSMCIEDAGPGAAPAIEDAPSPKEPAGSEGDGEDAPSPEAA